MMLHQDGSRHAWLDGQGEMDLIVTMDDATSCIYSAFLVEEEGTSGDIFRTRITVFTLYGPGEPLLLDTRGGWAGGQSAFDAGGAGTFSAWCGAHSGLLA
jgi:hypothetical protein